MDTWKTDIESRLMVLEKGHEDMRDKAFPAGDYDGHRRYHELMIEDIAARKRLTQAIKEKTVSGLIWAAVVFLAMGAWKLVVAKIGVGLGVPK